MKYILLLFICSLYFSSALYFKSKYVEKLVSETYENVVMKSKAPWFLNFGGDACEECRKLEPEFEKAGKALEGIARFGYVNPRSGKGIVDRFGINGEPVIIFLNAYKPAPHGSPRLFNFAKSFDGFMNFAWEEIPATSADT